MIAACLTVGFVAAPSASAADKPAKAQAAGKSKSKRVTAKTVNTKLNSTRKSLTSTRKSLGKLSKDLGALSTKLKTEEGKTALLLSAAPQLVTGLQTLAGAVQNQIAPGLIQLKTALETQVSPALTQLGTAVQTTIPNAIKEVATSQEYGVTRIYTGPNGAGGALPITFGSADIPDDGNTATASGELPIQVGPGAGMIPSGTLIALRSGIRSGETDGGGSGDPAGYVGGLLIMKCATGPAAGNCDLNPDPDPGAVTPVPPGTPVCIVGPGASQTINLPDGTTTNQAIQTIQSKAGRTDQASPAANGVNPLAGAAAAAGQVIGPLANDGADGCNVVGETGNVFTVTVQTQFLDLPTSTSPKTTD